MEIQELSIVILWEIRDVILFEQDKNGMMMFNVQDLAKKYKTSVGKIKAAFNRLEKEGLIEVFQISDDKRMLGLIMTAHPSRDMVMKEIEVVTKRK